MSTTKKKWDKEIPGGWPVGLYMQPAGANRQQRRASREHKNDPTPPGSMAPVVKRIKYEEKTISSKHEPMRTVRIPAGVEYVAQR